MELNKIIVESKDIEIYVIIQDKNKLKNTFRISLSKETLKSNGVDFIEAAISEIGYGIRKYLINKKYAESRN